MKSKGKREAPPPLAPTTSVAIAAPVRFLEGMGDDFVGKTGRGKGRLVGGGEGLLAEGLSEARRDSVVALRNFKDVRLPCWGS